MMAAIGNQAEDPADDFAEWHAIHAYTSGSETPTTYYGWGNGDEARQFVAIMTRKNPGVMYTWERLGNEEGFHPEDAFDNEPEMWGELI